MAFCVSAALNGMKPFALVPVAVFSVACHRRQPHVQPNNVTE
jgi:hypothetical protein